MIQSGDKNSKNNSASKNSNVFGLRPAAFHYGAPFMRLDFSTKHIDKAPINLIAYVDKPRRRQLVNLSVAALTPSMVAAPKL
jgi:hypothetical protein